MVSVKCQQSVMWTTQKTARCFYLLRKHNSPLSFSCRPDSMWMQNERSSSVVTHRPPAALLRRRQHSAAVSALTPLVWICFTPLNAHARIFHSYISPHRCVWLTWHYGSSWLKNIVDMFAMMSPSLFCYDRLCWVMTVVTETPREPL